MNLGDMQNLDDALAGLGLTLPEAPKPLAAYVPAVRSGSLLLVSGQLPLLDDELIYRGRVPSAVSIDQAQQAARQCTLNALAVVKAQLDGDWSRLRRALRLGVFVQCDDGFADQAQVANGASEFVRQIMGDAGLHARAAVGVGSLPLDAPVEIEFLFEVA